MKSFNFIFHKHLFQANRWIKSLEQENSLKICKMTDPNFMRYVEACIRTGTPLLLQEIGETLDPSIETVLLKQTFVQVRIKFFLQRCVSDFFFNFISFLGR